MIMRRLSAIVALLIHVRDDYSTIKMLSD